MSDHLGEANEKVEPSGNPGELDRYESPANFETFHECSEQRQWELYRNMRQRLSEVESHESALGADVVRLLHELARERECLAAARTRNKSLDGQLATVRTERDILRKRLAAAEARTTFVPSPER